MYNHSNRIRLPNVEESTSVVGNKHPDACSLRGDRATKMSSFKKYARAVNMSTQWCKTIVAESITHCSQTYLSSRFSTG